jgi:16S rRNA processing protein RimM
MSKQLFTVGKIVNTHGIRGELKILPQTDFPETRFKKGSVLTLFQPETNAVMEAKVQSAREHKNMYFVKFEQWDNINDVEKYKGWLLKVTEDQLVDLDEDEYYYYEIVGCKVVTDECEELGVITEILTPGANHVWVVERPKGKGKPILLPVIDDVILRVDVAEKIVTIQLMEGLLD